MKHLFKLFITIFISILLGMLYSCGLNFALMWAEQFNIFVYVLTFATLSALPLSIVLWIFIICSTPDESKESK